MNTDNLHHWADLGKQIDWFIENLNDLLNDVHTPASNDEDTQDTVTGVTQEMLDEVIRPALRQMSEVTSTVVGIHFRKYLADQQNNTQVVHQPRGQVVQHPAQYGY